MERRAWIYPIIVLAILGLSLACVYASEGKIETSSKVFKLKAQTYATPGTIGFKGTEIALQHLKEATGGRLDIKLYGGGAIVGLTEMIDAMGKGIIDCGINPTTFFAGKDPAFACLMTFGRIQLKQKCGSTISAEGNWLRNCTRSTMLSISVM